MLLMLTNEDIEKEKLKAVLTHFILKRDLNKTSTVYTSAFRLRHFPRSFLVLLALIFRGDVEIPE